MPLRCLPRLSETPLFSTSHLYTHNPAVSDDTTMSTFILQNASTDCGADAIESSSFTLTVLHNRVSFSILSIAKNFELSPTALQKHCAVFSAIENNDSRNHDLSKEVESFRGNFDKVMMEIAENVKHKQETLSTLRSYMYPFRFSLEAVVNESGDIVPFLDRSRNDCLLLIPGLHEDIVKSYLSSLLTHIDCYSSQQIRVLSCNEKAVPSLVGVDDQKFFFQPVSDIDHSSLKGLGAYDWILKDRELSANHKICHLRGLIIDDNNDIPSSGPTLPGQCQSKRLVGLLLDHIDVGATLRSYIASFNHTQEEKECWYKDICDVLGDLHARHIAWGNVSPDTVLIDREGQIHLTGFVGKQKGHSVDDSWRHSTEGDEQGLIELRDWLFDKERGSH